MGVFKNEVGRPSNETIKKRNIFKVICVLLVLIIIALLAYILNDKGIINIDNKKSNIDDKKITTTTKVEKNKEDNSLDIDTFLEKFDGVWGYDKYIIDIEKNEKTFLIGQYGTDNYSKGSILNIKNVDSNKYELKIFFEGCIGENCMEEAEDSIDYLLIEINDANNTIIYNDNEYQFITKDHHDSNTIAQFIFH